MKKSALILSALITVSSVTPVVAMQQNQQESTFSRIWNHGLLAFRDNVKAALKHLGKLSTDVSNAASSINKVVGDSKQEATSTTNLFKNWFNNTAQGFRNDLRQANIPGTHKIANDNDMSVIKTIMGGVIAYIAIKMALNYYCLA